MTDAGRWLDEALRMEDAGRLDEALSRYDLLVQKHPAHRDGWHNRGLLLARLGRLAEAERNHREYLQLHSADARARTDLADVLLALERYVEVLDCLAPLSSRAGAALARKAIALACLRRFQESEAELAQARRSDPVGLARFVQGVAPGVDPALLLSPRNIYLSRLYMATGRCDWSRWEEYVEELRITAGLEEARLEPAVAFMALHTPLDGNERHALARLIARDIEARIPPLPPAPPRSRGRIRVGVLSPDFRDHLNARLLLPLFELADRRRFEIYAYSLSPEDGSALRANIRRAADAFRDLHTLSDVEAAAAIRADDIDVLVDAGGHTTGGRFAITAQRPARVQASYLGFPCSLGSGRVDYGVVDEAITGSSDEWTERPVFLPHTHFIYDFRSRPQGGICRRDEYGLPGDAFVFCAFHRAQKITPPAFALWMRVLAAVPGSVLWLLAQPPTAEQNLRERAKLHGVAASRLIFAPFESHNGKRYFARQSLGDLFLDAPYHNAMTTACDALGAGLPVLTQQGNAMAGRVCAALVRAAGLPELVTPDEEAFVTTAIELATEPGRLRDIRERLERNRESAPLFDVEGRVRDLEQAFESMVAQLPSRPVPGAGENWLLQSAVPGFTWPAIPTAQDAALLGVLHQLDASQWHSRPALEAAQFKQLETVLRHAWNTVPHYGSAWAGVYDPAVAARDMLPRLPLLTKPQLQESFGELKSRAVPPSHGSLGEARTSGSTGTPVRVVKPEAMFLLLHAMTARNHLWRKREPGRPLCVIRQGVAAADHPTWGTPLDRVFATGPAHVMGVEPDVDFLLAWLEAKRPGYILTYPTLAAALARLSIERRTRLPTLLEVGTLGEPVDEATRALCRDAWDVPLADMYSAEEVGYIALQCPDSSLYHVQSENVIVEVLDHSGNPCAAGEIGRVVVTDLHNFAMPLIRYEIGDYAEVGPACPCGRGLPTLKRIAGRTRNMLVTADGKRYWPSFNQRKSLDIVASRSMQFVQVHFDHVEARLVLSQPLTARQRMMLSELFAELLPAGVRVSVVQVPSLPRGPGGKFEEFVCAIPDERRPG